MYDKYKRFMAEVLQQLRIHNIPVLVILLFDLGTKEPVLLQLHNATISQQYALGLAAASGVCSVAAIYLLLLCPHSSSIETEKLYPAIFSEWALSESGLRGLEAIKGIVQSAFRLN